MWYLPIITHEYVYYVKSIPRGLEIKNVGGRSIKILLN